MPQKVEVAVLVLSFNRPRMLGEALASIKGADEVVLLDDGSNFDVHEVVRKAGLTCRTVVNKLPPVGVEERMKVSRTGAAINRAIRSTSCEAIVYLCDDDLFHAEWLERVRQFFSENPDHFVRAPWGRFEDGSQPGLDLCNFGAHGMTVGNFAHRRSCCLEHDVWWAEKGVAVPDNYFVTAISKSHPWPSIKELWEKVAGWRRLHRYNIIQYTDGENFTPAAAEVLSREALET